MTGCINLQETLITIKDLDKNIEYKHSVMLDAMWDWFYCEIVISRAVSDFLKVSNIKIKNLEAIWERK